MAVETADDRAIFIGVDDFGVAATYNGGTINGIFDILPDAVHMLRICAEIAARNHQAWHPR